VDDEDTVTLTVDKVGNGGGIVTSSPGGIDCGLDCTEGYAVTRLPAPTVTLTPIPESDASFAGWSGPADCADGVVTPTSDLTCTATFVRLPIGQGAPDSAAVRAPLGSSLRLNGDAFGDVFAYSAASGAWARLLGNGAGALALERLDGWSPGWIVRAARLNADALDDFVLYNQVTGAWFKAVNDGTGGFTYFGSTWSPGWQLFVMDLDGNGLSDVLVYDPLTGAWFRGVNVGPADFVYTAGRWDPSWEVHPVEINGDGRTDLFLHNAASGTYYQAINNGVNDFTCNADGRSCQLEPLTVPTWSPGWQVTPAEFNNDGRSDLFLYNPTTGAYFIGLATGMTAPLEAYTFQGGTWSPGWTVRAGDFNADALADIFVYNVDTGAWFMELNNGAGGFTDHQGQPWSPGWQLYVVEAGGDGRSDLLLYSQATGQWYQAMTTGPGTFSYVTGFFDPDATVVAEVPIVP
jgi:hypothetical protein